MSTNVYPRETQEFVPITVSVGGVALTADPLAVGYRPVSVAVVPTGSRPATWSEADRLDGAFGFMLFGADPTTRFASGSWTVFAKVTDSPEIPVVQCGIFKIA